MRVKALRDGPGGKVQVFAPVPFFLRFKNKGPIFKGRGL